MFTKEAIEKLKSIDYLPPYGESIAFYDDDDGDTEYMGGAHACFNSDGKLACVYVERSEWENIESLVVESENPCFEYFKDCGDYAYDEVKVKPVAISASYAFFEPCDSE